MNQTAFTCMEAIAKKLLDESKTEKNMQVIVLQSSQGVEYATVIADALSIEKKDEKALLKQLLANKDTKLSYVLCMWENGGIDLPSYAFRKMLIDLEAENLQARLFVQTQDGIVAKPLSAFLPA